MKKIFEKLLNYIEDEDIRGLLRYCLILLPFVGGGILGMGFLVKYITIHKEVLILLGVATCMIVPAFMGKKKDEPEVKPIAVNQNLNFFNRMLIKNLFAIFNDYYRQFRVIPPEKYADLRDLLSSNFDTGKGFCIYRFKAVSDGDPVDPSDFHEMLEERLEEKLESGELALGSPTAQFSGKIYPKVYVDECQCAGNVWHITIMICDSDRVARYIDAKAQAIIMQRSIVSRQYEDSDF